MFKTMAIAFSMFSKIKMPQFVWEEKNMRYMLLAFPFVGIAVALSLNLFVFLCSFFEFSRVFTALGCVLVPILVTGGIHLDGFVDTCDAISSNLEMKRKLEILSDPHIGAFGVISLISYFLFSFGVFYELNLEKTVLFLLVIIFFASRCISSLTLVTVKKAKTDGLGTLFASTKVRKNIIISMINFLVISVIFAILINFKLAVFAILGCLVAFLYWYKCIVPKFGGTTGDLQGYLVQILEISMIFAIVLAQKVM